MMSQSGFVRRLEVFQPVTVCSACTIRNRIVFVLSCLSDRSARCSGYKTAAVPLLPSEIGEIHGAFKFTFPAFNLCVSGAVRIHTLDAKSADGTFEIPFIHFLHLLPREFKQSQHFRAGRVTGIVFDFWSCIASQNWCQYLQNRFLCCAKSMLYVQNLFLQHQY